MADQRQRSSNSNNSWPIYSLANYENSGFLLDSCRKILANSKPTRGLCTTSGYSTNGGGGGDSRSEQFNPTTRSKADKLKQIFFEERQRRDNSSRVETSTGLVWWHLIAKQRPASPLDDTTTRVQIESHRMQVLQLCSCLQMSISSFVESTSSQSINVELDDENSKRTFDSNSASARIFNQNSCLSSQGKTLGDTAVGSSQSAKLKRSRAARLRRANWRQIQFRARKPKSETGERQPDDKRLAFGGRTFSYGERDERPEEKPAHHQSSPRTILDNWLARADSRSSPRWSLNPLARGKYGESLIHILLINHSNEHLILAVLLVQLWPSLIGDLFESSKFYGLNCLHLAVAYANEQLLEFFLEQLKSTGSSSRGGKCCSLAGCIEQQVSGSLFRLPLSGGKPGRSVGSSQDGKRLLFASNKVDFHPREQRDGSNGNRFAYWCDQLEHWPTASGDQHFILLDRLGLSRDRERDLESPSEGAQPPGRSLPIYLGHTPLAWSVSFDCRPMFELLLAFGADINSQDSREGNSCQHQLVVNNQLGWTRFMLKLGADLGLLNGLRMTPFLLACHLGRIELFNELLELSAVEFWSYSSVRCCGYPLASLDSIQLESGGKAPAAVSVILESSESTNEQKSALLSSAVIKKLLEEKWTHFGRKLFYRDAVSLLVHLALMTAAISLRPTWADNKLAQLRPPALDSKISLVSLYEQLDKQRMIRHLSELATVLLSLNQLVGFGSEWIRYKDVGLQFTCNPLLANSVLANLLIVACVPLRLSNWIIWRLTTMASNQAPDWFEQAEDVLLILSAPLLWSSLLFFVAAFRVTGPFVAIIRHMVVRDLRQFSLIYLVFLYSFAQCIFFVNYSKQIQDEVATAQPSADWSLGKLVGLLGSYLELWMELFKMTLGVYELQPFRHSALARIFFLLFLYLVPILFNMLIAMMNNTYSLIISQSERAWSFQWARTLFALERKLSDQDKMTYLRRYSINLAAAKQKSDEDEDEDGTQDAQMAKKHEQFSPGLMIIKRTNCTRAEKRRLIVGYWQIQAVDSANRGGSECSSETNLDGHTFGFIVWPLWIFLAMVN